MNSATADIVEVLSDIQNSNVFLEVVIASVSPSNAQTAIKAFVSIFPPEEHGISHLKRARSKIDDQGIKCLEVLVAPAEAYELIDAEKRNDLELKFNYFPKLIKVPGRAPQTFEDIKNGNAMWPQCSHFASTCSEAQNVARNITQNERKQMLLNMNVAIDDAVNRRNLHIMHNASPSYSGAAIINPAMRGDTSNVVATSFGGAYLSLKLNGITQIDLSSSIEADNFSLGTFNSDTIGYSSMDYQHSKSILNHPLSHPTMLCLEQVAHKQRQMEHELPSGKFEESEQQQYLCTGYDIYLTQEPCCMCAMALIHSRIRRVIYGFENSSKGVLGSLEKLHVAGLNHSYRVFKGAQREKCMKLLKP